MPIVLSPLPLLSSRPLVDKQNLVVSAFPGDPFTGKAMSLLNTHAESFHLFFSIFYHEINFEINPQDPYSADASIKDIRVKHVSFYTSPLYNSIVS